MLGNILLGLWGLILFVIGLGVMGIICLFVIEAILGVVFALLSLLSLFFEKVIRKIFVKVKKAGVWG